jgi:hypothetical protein
MARNNMKTQSSVVLGVMGLACVLAVPAAAQASHSSESNGVYVAQLHPMNTKVTGLQTTGESRFAIHGDSLTITVRVKGAPPNLTHWQHFHGFTDNHKATCASQSADSNGDGVIDLVETEPVSGTTMLPFIDDPISMNVADGTYPKASAAGTYEYQRTISLRAMDAAFAKAFHDSHLDFDRRVVLVHGVGADVKLPASVASLGTIPPHVTLPIACGTIERVR